LLARGLNDLGVGGDAHFFTFFETRSEYLLVDEGIVARYYPQKRREVESYTEICYCK
jgi:hypothetical protein